MEPSGLEPPPACHAGALPAELWPQILNVINIDNDVNLSNNVLKLSYFISFDY